MGADATEAAPNSLVTSMVSSAVPTWCQWVPPGVELQACQVTMSTSTTTSTTTSPSLEATQTFAAVIGTPYGRVSLLPEWRATAGLHTLADLVRFYGILCVQQR